jgi:hypothetical protein
MLKLFWLIFFSKNFNRPTIVTGKLLTPYIFKKKDKICLYTEYVRN